MTNNSTDLVFSGVQPSGALHIGNYLGMLKPAVALQETYRCIYCVVDLHAITVPQDPKKLADQTREIVAAFLASGINPKETIVFAQSNVPAHAELAWYFNCVARMGWLERMTQFKEKSGKDNERSSVGLFDYPVLQAADILAYRSTHVPVGEDQLQHLELSKYIAERFNRQFNVPDFFPSPIAIVKGTGTRVMSLKDGLKKMSKSEPSDLSRINLTDDADAIARKFRKAKTDSGEIPGELAELDSRPEAKNLIGIYCALANQHPGEALNNFGGQGFSVLKNALVDLAVAELSPVSSEMRRHLSDQKGIDNVLREGAEKARSISEPIMREVRRVIGFWRP